VDDFVHETIEPDEGGEVARFGEFGSKLAGAIFPQS
jgi:hypothetical protein